jgi:flagellar basal body-associated protein FliL
VKDNFAMPITLLPSKTKQQREICIIIIIIIIITIVIIIIIISCHRFSFFPGTSPLEPVVNPTTQASSLSL